MRRRRPAQIASVPARTAPPAVMDDTGDYILGTGRPRRDRDLDDDRRAHRAPRRPPELDRRPRSARRRHPRDRDPDPDLGDPRARRDPRRGRAGRRLRDRRRRRRADGAAAGPGGERPVGRRAATRASARRFRSRRSRSGSPSPWRSWSPRQWAGPDPARPRPRHLRRRLALVPHAVRGPHRPDRLGDRAPLHRPALPQLVLSAELRAAPRRRAAPVRQRLPLAAAQPRLARPRAARRLVHRPPLRRRRRRPSPRSRP